MAFASLTDLGWRPFFQQQLSVEEAESMRVARVIEVQRGRIRIDDGSDERDVVLGGRWFQGDAETRPTVGDWVVLDAGNASVARVLDRESVFRRLVAGDRSDVQLIAANVDILFVVTSANEEFNVSRLERYLTLALDVGVQPVVVVTKVDLIATPDAFLEAAKSVRSGLPVELVNALDAATLAPVRAWCSRGQTVALLGSSGVGKSTLVNTLLGSAAQATAAIRESDSSGRHTTSHRSLHRLPDGGLLLDVPGMRELKIGDVQAGVEQVFDDIAALAARCRFSDCTHGNEPDCAVQAALESGELSERRLASFRKLEREQRWASETIAERHQRGRAFSKRVRQHQKLSHKKRD